MIPLRRYVTLISFSLALPLFAIESTKVLPKGVRNFTFKSVYTSVHDKTDESGSFQPIAKPLEKEMSFRKIVDGEKGINKMLLQSFLIGKFHETENVGVFTADMKGNISVNALIFSIGATDSFTLALGIPYYQAKMAVQMGFKASPNALKLVNYLNDPANNQTGKAEEVADKITNAVRELNTKLTDNGYAPIQNWEKSAFGDITLAGKFRFLNQDYFKMANAAGVITPTGYIGDPNELISIPFGTGSWGIFDTIYVDEYLLHDLWLNQYVKYTYQAPSHKRMRLKTEDEGITVPLEKIKFKIGDRFETGISAQYEPSNGLMFATGFTYTQKNGDRYFTEDLASKYTLEKNTDDWSSYWETRVGYQSIPAFLRKEFPVPFFVTFEFKKHLRSKNTVIKDLYALDLNLFI